MTGSIIRIGSCYYRCRWDEAENKLLVVEPTGDAPGLNQEEFDKYIETAFKDMPPMIPSPIAQPPTPIPSEG